MTDLKKICRCGTIDSLRGDTARIRIVRSSACSMCEASASCRSHEARPMLVDVTDGRLAHMHEGDSVVVEMAASSGRHAVLVAFVLPLLLVALAVGVGCVVGGDALAAVGALFVLAVYYVVLRVMRPMLDRRYGVRLAKGHDVQHIMRKNNTENNRQL